ncbi:DUF4129 domain-containing protein [Paenibacillus sp. FSL R7-269]|uniref:DUF4129 domain-containing protein n=1 Tax=Paenibacillus sp. FSL R7-269 TaxID=1226755 RepID=UPI003FA381B3
MRAAALAWYGLAARYGPPLPGVTAREYADSLAIEDGRLRAAVRGFVRQWETLAYGGAGGGVPLPASGSSGDAAPSTPSAPMSPSSPPNAADAKDEEAFMARCLMITFHLT